MWKYKQYPVRDSVQERAKVRYHVIGLEEDFLAIVLGDCSEAVQRHAKLICWTEAIYKVFYMREFKYSAYTIIPFMPF